MPSWSSLAPHLQGHILRFDAKPRDEYPQATGRRVLLIVLLLEVVLGPRLHLLQLVGLSPVPAWLRVTALLALALALTSWLAGVRPVQIGLRAWSTWGPTAQSYCVQVFVLANAVFATLFAKPIAALVGNRQLWAAAALAVATSLIWGFYQELVYRGLLQTELCRRWGPVSGILAANTAFTFGPLHAYHFVDRGPAAAAAMFAGIFAIGLFFGIVFRRSDNLWIVGLFHGLGDAYITGIAGLR